MPRASVRIGLSLVLVIHLSAVFLPPLAFQTGDSPSVESLFRWVRGYSQFLYLDRGYAFFAPNPGPSHLIQVAVTTPGGETKTERYPDRTRQWPRLLYHRHFMLTEYLHSSYRLPGPPPELIEEDPDEARYWARERERYESVRQSMLDHLEQVHPGKEIGILRLEHLVPRPDDFRVDPIELTDDRLYQYFLDRAAGSPEE